MLTLDHFQEISKMSILDPLACGFAKVIIYSVITETHNLVKNEDEPHTKYLNHIYVWQYDKIKRILGEKFFHVEHNSKFKEKFYQIKDNITDLNKRSPKTKNEVLATFSEEKWKNYRMTEINIQCLTVEGVSRVKP